MPKDEESSDIPADLHRRHTTPILYREQFVRDEYPLHEPEPLQPILDPILRQHSKIAFKTFSSSVTRSVSLTGLFQTLLTILASWTGSGTTMARRYNSVESPWTMIDERLNRCTTGRVA